MALINAEESRIRASATPTVDMEHASALLQRFPDLLAQATADELEALYRMVIDRRRRRGALARGALPDVGLPPAHRRA